MVESQPYRIIYTFNETKNNKITKTADIKTLLA